MFGIPYAKQDWIDAEAARAAARDPFGHRLHLLLAAFWLVLVPGPTSLVEFAGIGLAVISVLRAYIVHRTWRSLGCHPMLWAFLAWLAWEGASRWWSIQPDWHPVIQGRWMILVWLVWPVMGHRPVLIAALVVGFVLANLAQIVHGIGVGFDISEIRFNRPADRNAGWWQPVVGGSMLTAALGLHLPAAVMGVGWRRWVGLSGSALTLAGVVATGSRGAWIASAALIGIVAMIGAARAILRRDRAAILRLAGLAVAIAVALGVIMGAAGGAVKRRMLDGRDEVRKALIEKNYHSWTGERIYMLKWAAEEVRSRPWWGVGSGSYQKWAMDRQPVHEMDLYIHDHAHNTIAHIAATTGVIGVGLFAWVIVLGLRGGIWATRDRWGTYAVGPGFALLGLMLAGMTDVVHLNAQTSALMTVLFGLCFWPRPSGEQWWPDMGRGAWGKPFPKGIWRV